MTARSADEYQWIARWARYSGSFLPHSVKDQQGLAAAAGAPLDTVYYGEQLQAFITLRDIEYMHTLAGLMRLFPETRPEVEPLILKLARNLDEDSETACLEAEVDADLAED